MEIQGVETPRGGDHFPYSALRVLGGLHIALGSASVILGVTDLALILLSRDTDAQKYNNSEAYSSMLTLSLASTPIWCGMWFVVTGSMGGCMSRHRIHTLQFFRVSFLVLSILCSALFAPAASVVCGLVALQRHDLDAGDTRWLTALVLSFLAFVELCIAVVSASVCCCCSSVQHARVHVVFANPDAHGGKENPLYGYYLPDTPRSHRSPTPRTHPPPPETPEKSPAIKSRNSVHPARRRNDSPAPVETPEPGDSLKPIQPVLMETPRAHAAPSPPTPDDVITPPPQAPRQQPFTSGPLGNPASGYKPLMTANSGYEKLRAWTFPDREVKGNEKSV